MRLKMKTSTARVTLDQSASASAAPPVTAASFSTALHAAGFAGITVLSVDTALMLAYIPMPLFIAGVFAVALGMCALLFGVAVLHVVFDTRQEIVRYVRSRELTWFSQVRHLRLTLAVGFATLATAIAAWAIVFVVAGLEGSDGDLLRAVPRVAWVLALMFPVLAGLAWREVSRAARKPRGIRISPDGISVTHKHRGVQLRWNQLKSVRAGTIHKAGASQHRMVPCVTIMAADGTAFNVPALELGSDPNVVSAFLVHHRDRPEARKWLTNPEEAIRRFQAAQRPHCAHAGETILDQES